MKTVALVSESVSASGAYPVLKPAPLHRTFGLKKAVLMLVSFLLGLAFACHVAAA